MVQGSRGSIQYDPRQARPPGCPSTSTHYAHFTRRPSLARRFETQSRFLSEGNTNLRGLQSLGQARMFSWPIDRRNLAVHAYAPARRFNKLARASTISSLDWLGCRIAIDDGREKTTICCGWYHPSRVWLWSVCQGPRRCTLRGSLLRMTSSTDFLHSGASPFPSQLSGASNKLLLSPFPHPRNWSLVAPPASSSLKRCPKAGA
ncbi:uncharacterized protein LY79DRAFT_265935 [Colletotrichum navitas]|uniref:Uncharacterized protein n=1 Tax=Colletotrichum navitas TaxID=681940 RepID=A0AAD8V4B1_9PEZI|nr:uncharacterized protein LY79DRAFT_265935 [Colletotrichum navitas]KAK1585549.1 hypothetical protein LY79DRAFT_265935 [Colletotrichum navitas]